MAEDWIDLKIGTALFANLDADAVTAPFLTAAENTFVNELGGHTRFPGLIDFATLDDSGRVYLHDDNGDLVAATSQGQVYRLDRAANATNVTGLVVGGGRRVVFAKTDRDLLMAAGGPIVRLRGAKTELLSPNAPQATHVAWLEGFTLAVEVDSQRFFNSGAGAEDQWDPLDVFAADGSPDNINSMLVTPFRQVILGGELSLEQFERLPTGTTPFFRRWSIGDGVKLPYCQIFADNATWFINIFDQLAKFSGQASQQMSDPIAQLLEKIDDWTDAWIGGYPDRPLNVVGQSFILMQFPNATNPYGTKGVTLVYDYRQKGKFSSLYGWDTDNGVPGRWQGWSHWRLWDRTFVGGEGKIYEMTDAAHTNAGDIQRWLVRTSHIAQGDAAQVKNLRIQVVRGQAPSGTTPPKISVRCSRDGRPFGPPIRRSMGQAGDRAQFVEFGGFGNAGTHMFEFSCSEDVPINLIKAQVKVEALGH